MSFIDLQHIDPFQIQPGVQIRAPYGQNLMLSLVEIEEGGIVPLHSHLHEQGGVVLQGRMEMTIGSETRVLEPGALYIIPPNTPHEATAIGGPVTALDIFSPIREDYVRSSNQAVT